MSAAACIVSRRHGAGAATAWARRGHQRVAGGDTSRAGARRADGSGPPPSPRCVRTVAWPAAGRQLQAAVADGASEWERGVCGGGGAEGGMCGRWATNSWWGWETALAVTMHTGKPSEMSYL